MLNVFCLSESRFSVNVGIPENNDMWKNWIQERNAQAFKGIIPENFKTPEEAAEF